jgi:acylphosphatase
VDQDAETKAARWLVSGRVQGVGFRWFVVRRAGELGLTGWVRNLPDGRVEVVAAGQPAALTAMELGLAEGPRAARVDHVEKSSIPHEHVDANSFQVR